MQSSVFYPVYFLSLSLNFFGLFWARNIFRFGPEWQGFVCRSGEMNFTFSAGRKCPKAGRPGVAGEKKKTTTKMERRKWKWESFKCNLRLRPGAAVRQNESLEFIWNGKYDYNYKYCISRHKLSWGARWKTQKKKEGPHAAGRRVTHASTKTKTHNEKCVSCSPQNCI